MLNYNALSLYQYDNKQDLCDNKVKLSGLYYRSSMGINHMVDTVQCFNALFQPF